MKLALVALAALGCSASFTSAQAHRRHHVYHRVHRSDVAPARAAYPVTIGYGDTIISGRTGLHRSDFGVMVPDGTSPNFVLTGRRYGSGLGANGLPGSNLDN